MPKNDSSLLNYVDSSFPTSTPTHHSLDDEADRLLIILKSALKDKKEIEIYKDLDKNLIDSVGILAESGEARIYRNRAQRLCVRYAKLGLLSSIFSLSSH